MTLGEIYSSALRLYWDALPERKPIDLWKYDDEVLTPLRDLVKQEHRRQLDEIRRLGT